VVQAPPPAAVQRHFISICGAYYSLKPLMSGDDPQTRGHDVTGLPGMDGWVDGCLDGWMDGWVAGWMDGWVAGLMDGWMSGWMDGWLDGWMSGWMDDGWMMGGWMDG